MNRMSEAKFTRGEWRIGGVRGRRWIIAEYPTGPQEPRSTTTQVIADVYGFSDEEVVGNLNVMSASKALYAACEAHQAAETHHENCEACTDESWCPEGAYQFTKAISLRTAAMSKARGEG